MSKIYSDTVLSRLKVARLSGFIDWDAQPSSFKRYPEFLFRYKYKQMSELELIELTRIVTSRSVVGSKPYLKLNTPSAGNLHPLELYVQIRGIKGIISGIYHVDAKAEEIVLIEEINDDGLEQYVGLEYKHRGFIFLVSIVPFRSTWKYGDRSMRYCYLDAGHQVEAIQMSATLFGKNVTILSDYDENRLNSVMGFGNEEFICAVLSIGTEEEKDVKPFAKGLMQVAPTDYCEAEGYFKELLQKGQIEHSLMLTKSINVEKNEILSRRSARSFSDRDIDSSKIIDFLLQLNSSLSFYYVLQYSENEKTGLYLGGEMIKAGDFRDEMSALLVDQLFLKKAAMIIVITSENFDAKELMYAGSIVHQLYYLAQKEGMGFTGIGAFYDLQLQKFLNTKEYVHYVCALGGK